MKSILPEAQFDSLSIGVKLYNYFDGFSRREVQLFSYFSSLLFPYTKEPLSEWKYGFMIIDNFPFAQEINGSIDLHLLNGNYEEKNEFLIITQRGLKTFDDIKELTSFNKRENSINAACITSIMIPVRETENALLTDPEYIKQNTPDNPDWIKREYSIEQIKNISQELGIPLDNLVGLSGSWIKYISLINKASE